MVVTVAAAAAKAMRRAVYWRLRWTAGRCRSTGRVSTQPRPPPQSPASAPFTARGCGLWRNRTPGRARPHRGGSVRRLPSGRRAADAAQTGRVERVESVWRACVRARGRRVESAWNAGRVCGAFAEWGHRNIATRLKARQKEECAETAQQLFLPPNARVH